MKSSGVFDGLIWTWAISNKKESTFHQFQKAFQQEFLNELWRTPEYTKIKLKCFLYTLHIIQFKNTKDFCSVLRGPGFSTIEVFDVARGQKRAFCRFDHRKLKNFILRHLQKIMWFYLPATKDNLSGKVWGKPLFPCEMPWTALTETLSITSRFKLEILKKIFPSRNFFRKFWSRAYCTCNKPPRRIKHACTKHKIKEILIKSNTIRH